MVVVVVAVACSNINLSEVILKVACTRRNVMVRDKFTCVCEWRHKLPLLAVSRRLFVLLAAR